MIKSRLTQLKFNFIGEGVTANFMPNENDIEEIKNYSIEIINKVKTILFTIYNYIVKSILCLDWYYSKD